MKARYEADYLTAHREKLVLQSNLEEIRSGKSMGDGSVISQVALYLMVDPVYRAEAAIALRQRLNETVDELDKLAVEGGAAGDPAEAKAGRHDFTEAVVEREGC